MPKTLQIRGLKANIEDKPILQGIDLEIKTGEYVSIAGPSRMPTITDIVGVDYPNPSPVSYGAFTKVLGQFARDRQYMTQ